MNKTIIFDMLQKIVIENNFVMVDPDTGFCGHCDMSKFPEETCDDCNIYGHIMSALLILGKNK